MDKQEFHDRFTTPAYPNGDVTLLVVEIERMEKIIKSTAPLTPTGADVLKTCLRQLEQAKKVLEPFARIIKGTSGRIPTERLSHHNWHELIKFYDELEGHSRPVITSVFGGELDER